MANGRSPITDKINAAKKALGIKTEQKESGEIVTKPVEPKAQPAKFVPPTANQSAEPE